MSENYSDLREAEIALAAIHGEIRGLETACKYLREQAAKEFMKSNDEDAKLLRARAGMLHQEVEVLEVKRIKQFDKTNELREKES